MKAVSLLPTLAVASWLALAGAPAHAQRASLADRVAVLEQRAADNRGNVDLLNQVEALKAEVQSLRAQLEELQQSQEQAKSTSRSQYLDLDGRLNRLEGGAAPAIGAGTTSAAPPRKPAPAPAVAPDAPPAVYGDPGAIAKGADERASYEAAFDVLKAGRYADAANQFQDFLQAHPNGSYAPNALYWLGESYYVTQNYALAQEQFQALLDRYPTHDKAPGALLKVGLAQYGLKQFDQAEATLTRVTAQYPGTDAARTADDRLRALQVARVR